jgi:hypothetical protein
MRSPRPGPSARCASPSALGPSALGPSALGTSALGTSALGPSALGTSALGLAVRLALRCALGAGVLAAGSAACATSPGAAAAPARRNAAERPPPFASAPDFSVPDASGAPRDLASLMGPRGLVLVLYRGHW